MNVTNRGQSVPECTSEHNFLGACPHNQADHTAPLKFPKL